MRQNPLVFAFSVKIIYLGLISFFYSHESQMIMGVLWKRLQDSGKYWRHVYKVKFLKFTINSRSSTPFLGGSGLPVIVFSHFETTFKFKLPFFGEFSPTKTKTKTKRSDETRSLFLFCFAHHYPYYSNVFHSIFRLLQ